MCRECDRGDGEETGLQKSTPGIRFWFIAHLRMPPKQLCRALWSQI
jgi:hypothetical protein